MLIFAVNDPGLAVPQRQDGMGQRQPGGDQRSVLGNVMRREDEGNQVQAREIRESDLVAVPIRALAGDGDLRTGDDASSRDAAIHRAMRRHELLDDPVGATPAHLLEQVERVAALDVEHIETGQVLGKIRLRPAGEIQALAQEPMTSQLSFFFGDPRFGRPRPVRGHQQCWR